MKKLIFIFLGILFWGISINAQVNLQSGLIAYYPFNGNANDESGNGNNGTVNGATLSTDKFGNSNSAYYFNGVSNSISIPTQFATNVNEASFTTLMNLEWTSSSTIFHLGSSVGGEFRLETANNNLFFAVKLTDLNWYQVESPMSLNQWHFITAIYKKGISINLYIDGTLVNSLALPNLNLYTPTEITNSIGKYTNSNLPDSYFWKGKIDELRFYNRALNDSEIQALNNSGMGYSVTVPTGTNACYIAGTMNNWIQQAMKKIDATHFTLGIPTATVADNYKYYSGPTLAYIEKDTNNNDIPNRNYSANDVVAKWTLVYNGAATGGPVPSSPLLITPTAVAPAFVPSGTWDGTVDTMWGGIAAQPINVIFKGEAIGFGVNGSGDLDATFKATYDTHKLYFLFQVDDDVVCQASDYSWLGDKIEIYMGLPGYSPTGPALQTHGRLFAIKAQTAPTLIGEDGTDNYGSLPYSLATNGVQYSYSTTAKGYVLQVAIDRAIALESIPDNSTIAFDVVIADNDQGNGNPGVRYRKSWYNDGETNEPWNSMQYTGQLTLNGNSEAKTVNNNTAGGLLDVLKSASVLNTVTDLTITGNIDARDFVTMRDSCIALKTIDISNATIVSYVGSAGTNGPLFQTYDANILPLNAFYNYTIQGFSKTSLTSIKLPTSVTSITDGDFAYCNSLTSFTIPNLVDSIGSGAFNNCTSLTSINIPNSVYRIGEGTFNNCRFTSIIIPNSVNHIGNGAFGNCSHLTTIYAQNSTPVNLSNVLGVFLGVNTTTCTLYVPIGSKVNYQAAAQWKDFTNIVEISTTDVKTINSNNIKFFSGKSFIRAEFDGKAKVEVYNLSGILLKQAHATNTFTVDNLNAGLYIIKVNGGAYKVVLE